METHTKQCDFCHAEEGKPRPVGGYIVKLQTLNLDGATKRVCQSCAHKHHVVIKARKENHGGESGSHYAGFQHLKKFMATVLHLGIMLVIFSGALMAQPGLLSAPSQAPIDGGLGLLAAAGGAYAWKKLRDKRAENEKAGKVTP